MREFCLKCKKILNACRWQKNNTQPLKSWVLKLIFIILKMRREQLLLLCHHI